jgi:hypothetical protein
MFLCALCVLCGLIGISQVAGADSDSTTLRSADGQYQFVVPKGWEANDFHLDAVQIGAIEKHRGEYAEVIVENQADYTSSLMVYARAKRDTMAMSLNNVRLTAGQAVQVNGYDGYTFEIHGQLPSTNADVAYCLTVLRTKTHYVQVIGFVAESQFSKNRDELAGLAGGFSETGDSSQ